MCMRLVVLPGVLLLERLQLRNPLIFNLDGPDLLLIDLLLVFCWDWLHRYARQPSLIELISPTIETAVVPVVSMGRIHDRRYMDVCRLEWSDLFEFLQSLIPYSTQSVFRLSFTQS